MPFFFLLFLANSFSEYQMKIFRITFAARSASMVSEGSNPIHLFLSTCRKLVSPTRFGSQPVLSVHCSLFLSPKVIRLCIRSRCRDRTQLWEGHISEARARQTGIMQKGFSRDKAMKEESLCQPFIVDAFSAVSPTSPGDPPYNFAAAKDTILRKVIGANAHKESHKVEGYLQEDMR